jgi:hypothetical protein
MVSDPVTTAECNNAECGWQGHLGDCVCFAHDPARTPYCPECQETVQVNFEMPSLLNGVERG